MKHRGYAVVDSRGALDALRASVQENTPKDEQKRILAEIAAENAKRAKNPSAFRRQDVRVNLTIGKYTGDAHKKRSEQRKDRLKALRARGNGKAVQP